MVQLIKKGGLRERANRSRYYHGSENTEKTLVPNRYTQTKKDEVVQPDLVTSEHDESVIPQPYSEK